MKWMLVKRSRVEAAEEWGEIPEFSAREGVQEEPRSVLNRESVQVLEDGRAGFIAFG